MNKTLNTIQQNLIISIPITMLLGLAVGSFWNMSLLKTLIIPLTFLMVYPMMINLNFNKLKERGDFKLHLTAQVINFFIIPFIAHTMAEAMFTNPYHKLGLLLAALLPTSGMTISWTGFAKGNMSAAIKMTVIGLIAGSILTPLYIKLLLGAEVSIPLTKVIQQIAIVVIVPMILGILTRKSIITVKGKDFFEGIKPSFKQLSTLGVLGIVFVAMALKSKTILATPGLILELIIPITLLYLVNFIISTITARKLFNYSDGIALVFGTVMRNLSIALAIAMSAIGESGSDVAIVIAFSYIIQVQAGAWYVKITDKLWSSIKLEKSKSFH